MNNEFDKKTFYSLTDLFVTQQEKPFARNLITFSLYHAISTKLSAGPLDNNFPDLKVFHLKIVFFFNDFLKLKIKHQKPKQYLLRYETNAIITPRVYTTTLHRTAVKYKNYHKRISKHLAGKLLLMV